jgi:hypothetical protein
MTGKKSCHSVMFLHGILITTKQDSHSRLETYRDKLKHIGMTGFIIRNEQMTKNKSQIAFYRKEGDDRANT